MNKINKRTLDKLFEPITINGMTVRNRIVVPPMDTGFGSTDHEVTDQLIAYHRRRAEGGMGLIIVEYTSVDPGGRCSATQLGVYDDRFIPGFRRLTEAVHAYGAKVALQGMRQQGFGTLYNMEGLGSDGRKVEGLTLYGCTKSALRYLTDALAQEVKGSPVQVGSLSPGMVVTDLLTKQYEDRPEEWEHAQRIFNILADRVETVTPWLAEKVLNNKKNGARIKWLTRRKSMGRFLAATFRKRNLFEQKARD